MPISVRSYLVAGAAAATATAIAVTPIHVAPADIAVPAHPTSTQPQLTQAMIDLLAAASRMTAAVTPKPSSGGAPALGVAPAAAVTAPVTPQPTAIAIAPNLANTIDQLYGDIEPWVQYGFEVAASILGWVPWVGGWAGGLLMDGYTFGESLVASGVYNFTDWLRGDGGIVTNLADFGVDAVLAVAWLGLDVVNTFIPLPPIPLPPRPPLQGPFAAAALAAPATTFGAAIQNPLTSLTDAIAKAGADFAAAIKTLGIRGAAGTAAAEANPVVEVVKDAVEGAEDASKNLATGVADAVETVSNDAGEQLEHLIDAGKLKTARKDDVAVVPNVVSQSLRGAGPGAAIDSAAETESTVGTALEETQPDTPRARLVRSGRDGVRTAVGNTTADVKRATDSVRSAFKAARDKAAGQRADRADAKTKDAKTKKAASERGKSKTTGGKKSDTGK
ncbi:hypothetical protein A5740_08480 [Mycobacterium sp. GA-1841]|uniref:hypothetical protein n=1 Tax=Mycobacterium sp. GA-1841 TaxID=1834154 RepID=UPI00096F7AFB|nr:hypothetical protein [Mycobacterium sp. GA-1841]OMC35021.1 hypothetical protein A5740_08480 [Mycobacterium sp. GA-1841]